jgi:hypothetical protein
MNVVYHPDFARDVRKFADKYRLVYPALGERFRMETREAIQAIKLGPESAGHLLHAESGNVHYFRRRNLNSFPFFVLYGCSTDFLIFGSVIPSRSDPLTWLSRFPSV